MSPDGLTILTYPTLPWFQYPWLKLKLIAKFFFAIVRHNSTAFRQLRLGGHPAVTRSLLSGSQSLGLRFNLNPARQSQLYSWVIVLSSVEALQQAIRLRARGLIQHLWAGPNLVVLPTEHGGILAHPLIDRVVVPSTWVADQYARLIPQLRSRIVIWPAGVDTDEFMPSLGTQARSTGSLRVLHYNKLSTPQSTWAPVYRDVRCYLDVLRCCQVELAYGCYSKSHYAELLRRSDFMIYWTDAGESQGLALLESWASDVPTFVSENHWVIIKGVPTSVSSAPYLSQDCGSFFASYEELISLIDDLMYVSSRVRYQPRRWVTTHMSDALSAQMLINLFETSVSTDSPRMV